MAKRYIVDLRERRKGTIDRVDSERATRSPKNQTGEHDIAGGCWKDRS